MRGYLKIRGIPFFLARKEEELSRTPSLERGERFWRGRIRYSDIGFYFYGSRSKRFLGFNSVAGSAFLRRVVRKEEIIRVQRGIFCELIKDHL